MCEIPNSMQSIEEPKEDEAEVELTCCKSEDETTEIDYCIYYAEKEDKCSLRSPACPYLTRKCGLKSIKEVELTDKYVRKYMKRKCPTCFHHGNIRECISCIHNYREVGKD